MNGYVTEAKVSKIKTSTVTLVACTVIITGGIQNATLKLSKQLNEKASSVTRSKQMDSFIKDKSENTTIKNKFSVNNPYYMQTIKIDDKIKVGVSDVEVDKEMVNVERLNEVKSNLSNLIKIGAFVGFIFGTFILLLPFFYEISWSLSVPASLLGYSIFAFNKIFSEDFK